MCVHVCKDNRVCTTSIIRVDNRMDFFFLNHQVLKKARVLFCKHQTE